MKNCYELDFLSTYDKNQTRQSTGNKYFNFHLHKSRTNIIQQIQNERPIRLITIEHNNKVEFAVVLNKSLKRNTDDSIKYDILVIQINSFQERDCIYLGQCYYSISLLNFQTESIVLDEIKGYHIGLPFIGKYTCVSSNWEDFYIDKNNNQNYTWG